MPHPRVHRCVALLGLLLVAACTSPEERLARHVERGEAFLRDADTRAALLEFQSALSIQPENAELYERIADVLVDYSQLYPEALSYFREAQRLDPTRIHPVVAEARLIALEEPTRAHRLLDRAFEQAPENSEVWRTKAFMALLAKDEKGALAAAEKAIELEPIPPNYAELGAVYLAHMAADVQRGRKPRDEYYEKALEAYRRVNELEGGRHARAVLEQARVLGLWGRDPEADALFREALAMASDSGAAEIEIVAFTMLDWGRRSGDLEIQREALRALAEALPDRHDVWRERALVEDEAAAGGGDAVYAELLQLRPNDPKAHLAWAEYLQGSERPHMARSHVQRVRDEGIDDAILTETLVRLELQLGNLEGARQALAELREAHPDELATRVAAARVALVEDHPEEAERLLVVATREQPSPELLRLLALAYHYQGRSTEARRTLDQAMEASPRELFPLLRLAAKLEAETGNWPAVMEALQELLLKGQTLSDPERVLFAQAAYHTGYVEKAQTVLLKLIAVPRPIAPAAVAYAELFGIRSPLPALAALRVAHHRALGDPELVRQLTRIEMRLGLSKLALDRLDMLIQAQRASAKLLFVRADLLASMGAYERAEADALRAFEADPALPGAIDLLHELYRAQGRLETARAAFEEADAAGVLHPGARLLMARLLLDDGETDRAREMIERVVAERPELWQARGDLAYVLALQGQDLERALDLARDAQLASRRSPATTDVVGWVHLQAGRPHEALVKFQDAVRDAERRDATAPPRFHYHVGLAYRALGRDAEADAAFRTALGLGEFAEAEEARRQLEAARHPAAETGSSS